MTFLETFRRNAAKRASYRRTVNELRKMPRNVAIDLDIDRENARSIAYTAVYGL
jgi:uncharacterized protein YjiS (DUF1127 family)